MKTGLVMEGGSMRGMFTAGVTDVFMENNISFDGAVGVSAGAGFGCNYKSRQPGRAIRYSKRFCKDKRYASWCSWIKTGNLYNVDFVYTQVPRKYDIFDEKAYRENPMEFYVVCTDIETGMPVYHKCEKGDDEDINWMRASASLPMLSKTVEIDGFKLSDGGTADSIPLRFFEKIGYNRNVVILTQPNGFVKEKNSLLPLLRITERKYPEFIKALENRHNMYNETLEYIYKEEQENKVLVLRPEAPLDISGVVHDENELERVYRHGRMVGEKALSRVREFLTEGRQSEYEETP